MASASPPRQVLAGLAGGHGAPGQHLKQVPLPAAFTPEHLATAQRDAEVLAAKLSENPDAVRHVLDAAASGDFANASQHLEGLGLTEEQLKAEGGGLFWLLVVVVLLILLYPSDAE
jgi:hypothetical protein